MEKLPEDVILPKPELTVATLAVGVPDKRDRTILPPPESPFKGKIETAMKDSTQDWPQPLKAPEGAPNVFMIIGDDIGFGTPSASVGARFTNECRSLSGIVGAACVKTDPQTAPAGTVTTLPESERRWSLFQELDPRA